MTFTRAVFGPRGNLPHVVLAWAASVAFEAINCIFGVYALLALMPLLGWEHPGDAGKILATLVVLGASAIIAIFGHATHGLPAARLRRRADARARPRARLLRRRCGMVGARAAGTLTTWETIAVILAAGAVIASGPISYLFNAPDWVRYLPSRTPSAAIFWTVFLASGADRPLPSVMGVLLASRGDMSDPVAGVEPFVPEWLYILFILAAVGGSIANNVVAYYSSGLCLQSAGLPLRRYQATALDTVVSTAMVLYILLVQDFTTVLHHFVALLVVWLGPFAAVWITDGLMRRWQLRPRTDPRRRPDAAPTGAGTASTPRGWIALLAGVVVCC